MVEFDGVCNFDRAQNGLVPIRVDAWENFVFVNLDPLAAPLHKFLGAVPELVAPLQLTQKLQYFDRRVYTLRCNWKVYVDNYLDGGYRSEEHTSELQSHSDLVCRLLLEKKKT